MDDRLLAPRWVLAATVAALGSWVLFDAMPGINWGLWTGAAVAGQLAVCRASGRWSAPVAALGAAAVAVAAAAALTASGRLSGLIVVVVAFLLAGQMLMAATPSLRSLTLPLAALAPPVAFRHAVVGAARQAVALTQQIRSPRARGLVRGLVITVPVVVAFALLLADADPLFAAWRESVGRWLGNWDFVPRVVFFSLLLVIVLGAYAHASLAPRADITADAPPPGPWFGATERIMLLAAVAALFWLFLAVQVGYFFGNLPATAASGTTFAEYARRGFGELTFVATVTALLVVASERFGSDDGRGRIIGGLTLAVLAAVMLLLASAVRRVWLYEAAYGYTTARLYAQVAMAAIAAGLVALALEVAGSFDPGRLFRRAAGTALLLFIALLYWNHEAWIAGRNLDRYRLTGKLDVFYLARGLSADAVPVLVARAPELPEPVRSELVREVRNWQELHDRGRPAAWFEWNRARVRADQALDALGSLPQPPGAGSSR